MPGQSCKLHDNEIKDNKSSISTIFKMINGNGNPGIKSEVASMKTTLKFQWALLVLILSINGTILIKLFVK